MKIFEFIFGYIENEWNFILEKEIMKIWINQNKNINFKKNMKF